MAVNVLAGLQALFQHPGLISSIINDILPLCATNWLFLCTRWQNPGFETT